MYKEQAQKEKIMECLDKIFESLPPLDSFQYMSLLSTATVIELPPQVLVRAFRQLCTAGVEKAAQATLERLLDKQYEYLSVINYLAKKHIPRSQNWQDPEDLVQEAVIEIVKKLPTERGILAEKSWKLFCKHCFFDVWRSIHGRHGEKLKIRVVPLLVNEESGELIGIEEDISDLNSSWRSGIQESLLPLIEKIIEKTIANIADPLIHYVAEDQFGDNPSPICSGSINDKPPLTEQLGVDRFKLSRALKHAKTRLAAALLANKECEIDKEWLQKFIQ